MEVRHLKALVAVSEHGSFSGAADALGTVQSNVSAHVARLERELGTPLVDRSAGRLTAEGEVVAARAYRILGEIDAVTADLGALRKEVGGTVRIGMIGTTARWITPRAVGRAARQPPQAPAGRGRRDHLGARASAGRRSLRHGRAHLARARA